ncbi:MAG: hypothetical protein U0528_18185 [Anaerolineae bacterium]
MALQPFAKAHFDFFITGFTPDDANKAPLLINTIYPPEHVLRAVETRIAVDTPGYRTDHRAAHDLYSRYGGWKDYQKRRI